MQDSSLKSETAKKTPKMLLHIVREAIHQGNENAANDRVKFELEVYGDPEGELDDDTLACIAMLNEKLKEIGMLMTSLGKLMAMACWGAALKSTDLKKATSDVRAMISTFSEALFPLGESLVEIGEEIKKIPGPIYKMKTGDAS